MKLLQIFQVLPFFDRTVDKWATEARLLRWLTFLWLFVGLAVLFSASYPVADNAFKDGAYYFKYQAVWILVGLIVMKGIVHLPLRFMLKINPIFLFITLILLFATYITGTTRDGATRWLSLGSTSLLLQPSELIKPFLILQAAQIFGNWKRLATKTKVFWIAIFLLSLLGILLQPSLSVTALCGITLWLIALGAGLPSFPLFATAGLGLFVGFLSVSFRRYQMIRIMTFLDPWKDQQGDGFQLVQSLMAIGSGGLWGTGFGLSQQKLFLPIQYTDFIFAIFAEEFGLFGCLCLLILVFIYGTIGLSVTYKCKDPIVRLVALGSTCLITLQSILNVGVATGVLPTTGLPFPFFSYGGSSTISCLVIAGLLIRSAREMAAADVLQFPQGNGDVQTAKTKPKRQEKTEASRRRSHTVG
ncbi:FtsW/RodA/SpoVE family cell cycle protein [Pseudanabaena mucicola]|uniref:Probable peptidoglycan glycosyltransferase FtsW n=1 Tax=Pseudanabaena mucicola FACHB-723 TaxID=2692860 RepID=A0ABR8A100_9CYAN|nr:FtsW/RodA/SpoVE family cell cycle protein [Pseudanabaena mucicola]MBD2189693.1 cell division protein FtsW [Pseudanabaena mucicola FACHB-723]